MLHNSKIPKPPTWNYVDKNILLPNYRSNTSPAVDVHQVFKNFKNTCTIKKSSVLEVGGVFDNQIIEQENIKEWLSVDKFSENLEVSNRQKIISSDICKYEPSSNHFDYVFSCNALHHINPLETFFENIFKALKTKGIAYLHFGPIWSAPDGHHLDINVNSIVYRFDGISLIPHWYHLLYSADELYKLLTQKIDSRIATEAVNYIYNSIFLNRNYYEDYIAYAIKTGFSILQLSAINEIDYEYHEPDLNCQSVDERIIKLRKLYPEYKNFFTRDLLMILLKP